MGTEIDIYVQHLQLGGLVNKLSGGRKESEFWRGNMQTSLPNCPFWYLTRLNLDLLSSPPQNSHSAGFLTPLLITQRITLFLCMCSWHLVLDVHLNPWVREYLVLLLFHDIVCLVWDISIHLVFPFITSVVTALLTRKKLNEVDAGSSLL